MNRTLRSGIALLFIGGVLASCGSSSTPAASAKPAASAAPAAAAPAAGAGSLILQVDTVSGNLGTTDEEKAALSCVQKNRFPQGESIVWRVKVFSTVTGKALDDKAMKPLAITLPDGKTEVFKYGPHPKGQTDDYFWAWSFKIPENYPTGTFKYKLVAESNDGLKGEYTQFNVASAMLQVVKAGAR